MYLTWQAGHDANDGLIIILGKSRARHHAHKHRTYIQGWSWSNLSDDKDRVSPDTALSKEVLHQIKFELYDLDA